MVLKQKKFSVPSGTTFRTGSHSYRTKYLKQATVVKTLRNAPDDHVDPSDDLCPGVEYSLNKKGRWNLPKQIRDDEFDDSDFKISLQQFHKIKRKAKCVSYEANKGPFRKVVPKKYYFDVGSVEPRKLKKKVIEREEDEEKVSEDPKEPLEVVYSVYMPAGSKSAITYNPKYIDVPAYASAEDSQVLTAVSKKGRTNNRAQLRVKNSDDFSDEEDWSTTDESADDLPLEESDWLLDEACGGVSEWGLSDGFDGFIDIALQRKELEKYEKLKSEKKSTKPKSTGQYKDRKVYVDSPHPEQKQIKIKPQVAQLPTLPISTNITILGPHQTRPDNLILQYGINYQETQTQPRGFVVDISETLARILYEDVNACLSFQQIENEDNAFRLWLQSSTPMASLDAVPAKLTSVDDVISCVCNFRPRTSTAKNDAKNKPKKTQKRLALKDKRYSQFHSSTNPLISRPIKFTNLKAACGWTIQTQTPHQLLTEPNEGSPEVHLTNGACAAAPSNDTDFCAICYTECDDQSAPLMSMTSCGHVFCEQCWTAYVWSVLKTGVGKVTCPDYECSAELSDGLVQSLVSPMLYKAYLTVKMDNFLATNKWSWCPNTQCGRVVKTEAKGTSGRYMNVDCECRLNVCNDCKDQSHWPATCDQTRNYRQMLKERGDDDRRNYVPPVLVNYVVCPNCARAVEKVVGCNYVACVCGKAFCWGCGKDWESGATRDDQYHYACFEKKKVLQEAELTHIPPPKSMDDVPALYVQAVHHHHQMGRDQRTLAAKQFSNISKRVMNSIFKSVPNKFGYSSQSVQVARADLLELEHTGLEVLSELHHCVEYTSVALLYTKTKSLPCQKVLEKALDKILFVTRRFYQLLAADDRPATEIVEHLRNYTKIGRTSIFQLVSALKVNDLS